MKKHNINLTILAILMPLLAILSCASETALKSEWKTPTVTSSNPDTTWQRASTYAWEDQNILLGVQNDTKQLTILLRARDRATQSTIMRDGLTIWIDPTAKKGKTFGIHYPIGKLDSTGNIIPPKPGDSEIGWRSIQMPDTMEIIKADKRIKTGLENDLGISVLTSNNLGTITYQFSVPMTAISDSSYAVSPGSTITLGFETGAMKFTGKNRSYGSPDSSHTGQYRPPREWGDHGSDYDSLQPHDRMFMRGFEPVDFWTKVTLALEN